MKHWMRVKRLMGRGGEWVRGKKKNKKKLKDEIHTPSKSEDSG